MQVDHRRRGANGVEEFVPKDVHPSSQHDDVRSRIEHDPRDFSVVRRARPHLLLLLLLLLLAYPFFEEFALGRGGLEVRLQGEVAGRDRRVGRLRAREAVSRLAVREDEHDPRVGKRGRILRIDQRLQIRPCGAGITRNE